MLGTVHWWILVAIAVVLLSLYGLYRWASADPGVDAEIAREHFRAEQERRALRRVGKDSPATGTR